MGVAGAGAGVVAVVLVLRWLASGCTAVAVDAGNGDIEAFIARVSCMRTALARDR